ncbi:MAG: glycosyltransferase [Fibrobacterota bacterium]|nr:glycosyltransferase [Fibrobacterota bacterium]QQS03905.1 MAG: glycosyltransferase [Fibrobacterota bacterium]
MSVAPSILLVRSPLLGLDLEIALLERCAVRTIHPIELSQAFLEAAKRSGTRGVVTVNRSPEVALLCREAGLRYVSWSIDPLSRNRWEFVPGADEVLLVHRKVLVAPLIAMGHAHVEWLPLAAPERRWESLEGPVQVSPPSFVGSSLQDERRLFQAGLVAWGVQEAASALEAHFVELSAIAESEFGFHGFLRDPRLVPASLATHLAGVAAVEDIAECLDAGLAWVYRREQVRWWARSGIQVFGDGGWQEVVGEAWRGPLRNGQEMTRVYRDAALNVDAPRLHQREIATLRAFDVLASGGLLLVEAGTELEDLFCPGEEFLVWKTPDQRGSILEESLRNPDFARKIGSQGKEAAWGHRLGLRALKILEALQ